MRGARNEHIAQGGIPWIGGSQGYRLWRIFVECRDRQCSRNGRVVDGIDHKIYRHHGRVHGPVINLISKTIRATITRLGYVNVFRRIIREIRIAKERAVRGSYNDRVSDGITVGICSRKRDRLRRVFIKCRNRRGYRDRSAIDCRNCEIDGGNGGVRGAVVGFVSKRIGSVIVGRRGVGAIGSRAGQRTVSGLCGDRIG